MRNKYVVVPILIHIFVVVGLLVAVISFGANYHDMLLVDDGYYNIARDFVHGDTLLHKFRGPVLPLMLSILFIFPQSLHPFIRLLMSLVISGGVVITVYHITKDYIAKKQFLIGSLIFLLNPVYIHWTFRSSPEQLLALLIGLFILCVIKFFRTNNTIYLFFSAVILFLSFFIKPVFLFIPVLLLFSSILLKSKTFALAALLLVLVGVVAYVVQDQITGMEYSSNTSRIGKTYDYKHKILLITDSFWTDYILRTRQFYKPTVDVYEGEYKNGKSLNEFVDGWLKDFYEQYPNSSLVCLNLYFVHREPLLVMQKLIVSPLFYFSMSARPKETLLKLIFSFISIIFAILGLRSVLRDSGHKKEITIIISIIIGFISLHLLTHAMNRYSLPILPYLYIWGGIPLSALKNKFCDFFKQQTSSAAQNE